MGQKYKLWQPERINTAEASGGHILSNCQNKTTVALEGQNAANLERQLYESSNKGISQSTVGLIKWFTQSSLIQVCGSVPFRNRFHFFQSIFVSKSSPMVTLFKMLNSKKCEIKYALPWLPLNKFKFLTNVSFLFKKQLVALVCGCVFQMRGRFLRQPGHVDYMD